MKKKKSIQRKYREDLLCCLNILYEVRFILFSLCCHLSVRFSHTRCSSSREKTSSPCLTFPNVLIQPQWEDSKGMVHSWLQPEWSCSTNSICVIMNVLGAILSNASGAHLQQERSVSGVTRNFPSPKIMLAAWDQYLPPICSVSQSSLIEGALLNGVSQQECIQKS